MTEQEFMRQIWRPYDTVQIEGGFTGTVSNVCFPSRSVKVRVTEDAYEWIKADLIVKHTCRYSSADNSQLIETLKKQLQDEHNRAEKLNEKVEKLNLKVINLKAKDVRLQEKYAGSLRHTINSAVNELRLTKKAIECIDRLDRLVNECEQNKSTDNI